MTELLAPAPQSRTVRDQRDYTDVTITSDVRVAPEAIDMAYVRYAYAAQASGGDVLEVGCGAGVGLRLLAARPGRVVGADYSEALLAAAHAHAGVSCPLVRLEGGALPFRAHAFDLVVLHEAIYYLPSAADFVAEARRVLRPGGALVVSSVNPRWRAFQRSPHSTTYFSAAELHELLARQFESVAVVGAFPDVPGAAGTIIALLKKAAAGLGLFPKSMKAKEALKRIFFGPLVRFPDSLDPGRAREYARFAFEAARDDHRVLYATAR